MSDYFGALLRSAGLTAVAGTPAAFAAPTPAAADEDLVEQATELSAGAPVAAPLQPGPERSSAAAARSATSAVPALAPPTRPVHVDRATTTHATHVARTAATPPTPPIASDVATPPRADPMLPATPGQRAAVAAVPHPLVQAALRWVSADPAAEAAVARRADMAASRAAIAPLLPAAPRPAPAPATNALPAASTAVHAAIAPRAHTPATAEPVPPAVRSRAERVEPAHPPEVHIGTIHVSVDAPRPVLAPPAPAPRPQAAASAPRSAYLRSRAPRL